MSYERGMEDALRLVSHEGKKASNISEIAEIVEHLRGLAKQKGLTKYETS
jgi:replicative DNA helicase